MVGRSESYWYLAVQAKMLASSSALPSAKKSLTSWSAVLPFIREKACANSAMCPGGNSVFGPSAQYSAFTFCASDRLELSASSLSMSAVAWVCVPSAFGPGSANCGG